MKWRTKRKLNDGDRGGSSGGSRGSSSHNNAGKGDTTTTTTLEKQRRRRPSLSWKKRRPSKLGSGEKVDQDHSQSTVSKKQNPTTIYFKIVLLLIDPQTCRFELLHLEFDSSTVVVDEVIRQISLQSANITEEVLRKKTYIGLCSSDGIARMSKDPLSSFCTSTTPQGGAGGVFVAIPDDLSANEIVQLALPILTNEKIVQMFHDIGVDSRAWAGQGATMNEVAPTTAPKSTSSQPKKRLETNMESSNKNHPKNSVQTGINADPVGRGGGAGRRLLWITIGILVGFLLDGKTFSLLSSVWFKQQQQQELLQKQPQLPLQQPHELEQPQELQQELTNVEPAATVTTTQDQKHFLMQSKSRDKSNEDDSSFFASWLGISINDNTVRVVE